MLRRCGWLAVASALLPAAAAAQQRLPTPRAGFVYPAGGQQGTTMQVIVGGQNLNGAARAFVSGAGVQVRVVEVSLPVLGQRLTMLRDTAQALTREMQQRGLPDPAMRQRIMAIRDTIAESVQRQQSPALAHRVTLEVTISANAAPGQRWLRVQTPVGLTNPMVFCVGELPEVTESADKATRADAEMRVAVPAIVNGRLIPGDVGRRAAPIRQSAGQYRPGDADRYRFAAKRGQKLVAALSARALNPYLGDAVPGWFQGVLTLYDSAGRELASVDDWRFDPDPMLPFEVPADGDYVLEVKDALYRGRDDFVYRLAIGELPVITDVFPLGARAGARAEFTFTGWNLPTTRGVFEATQSTPGMHRIALSAGGRSTNVKSVLFDGFPSGRPEAAAGRTARVAALPVAFDGRIAQPGERAVFTFNGTMGDTLVAAVLARRLGSPMDAVIEVLDPSGRRIARNDDFEDRAHGLVTHHADSYLMTPLPATGTYTVRVADIQGKGGPAYAYRLQLGRPRPDFELRMSPSSINVSAGGAVPITVTAIRHDGFSGDIQLTLASAPSGVTVSGGLIPAGQDKVRMTISAPPVAATGGALQNTLLDPAPVALQGEALINGTTVVRPAVAAEDMMQAFAYHHLVPTDGGWMSVLGRGAVREFTRVVTALPLRLRPGVATRVRVEVPVAFRFFTDVRAALNEAPDGITITDVTHGGGSLSFSVLADAAKVKQGLRGTLIVEVSGERPNANLDPNAPKVPAAQRRVIMQTLPAMPFAIVP